MSRRSFYAWGYADQALSPQEREQVRTTWQQRLGCELRTREVPRLEHLDLRAPRLSAPSSLAHLFADDRYQRALHTYGRSTPDAIRMLNADFSSPPDLIAFPASESDISAILEWCGEVGAAVVPYGGGTSVVGGIGPVTEESYSGVVTVDLGHLNRVLEIDHTSRAMHAQAGIAGPAVEDALRPEGLTLRHYPQSFEFSTLGGWIATRSAGHYATVLTHIDDVVEGLRIVTPAGLVQTRRLPGSGAGPSPDRLFIGSEGALGIITEAWVRVQNRPTFRSRASIRFSSFESAVSATRALVQSGLNPANCRLLDACEAEKSDAGPGPVILVGFESADHPMDALLTRATELACDHGGELVDPANTRRDGGDPAGSWRSYFLRAPYVSDAMFAMGLLYETYETATTWDRFWELHASVLAAARRALESWDARSAWVSCRFTHVYPDGPAPYYSIVAPGPAGSEMAMWTDLKRAISEAIMAAGGTITHHHAVGRDHRPWYDAEQPDLFKTALRAAKQKLDPSWSLNPGVLLDPRRS
jgi:alkyldihydroxyacetonephosphate synthase